MLERERVIERVGEIRSDRERERVIAYIPTFDQLGFAIMVLLVVRFSPQIFIYPDCTKVMHEMA